MHFLCLFETICISKSYIFLPWIVLNGPFLSLRVKNLLNVFPRIQKLHPFYSFKSNPNHNAVPQGGNSPQGMFLSSQGAALFFLVFDYLRGIWLFLVLIMDSFVVFEVCYVYYLMLCWHQDCFELGFFFFCYVLFENYSIIFLKFLLKFIIHIVGSYTLQHFLVQANLARILHWTTLLNPSVEWKTLYKINKELYD